MLSPELIARVRRERPDRPRLRRRLRPAPRRALPGVRRARTSRSSPAPRATAWPGSSACSSRPTSRSTSPTPASTGWSSLPPGPINIRLPKVLKVPEGPTYAWTENPLGINGYYLVSRGEKTPWRLKLRSASFNNVQVLDRAAARARWSPTWWRSSARCSSSSATSTSSRSGSRRSGQAVRRSSAADSRPGVASAAGSRGSASRSVRGSSSGRSGRCASTRPGQLVGRRRGGLEHDLGLGGVRAAVRRGQRGRDVRTARRRRPGRRARGAPAASAGSPSRGRPRRPARARTAAAAVDGRASRRAASSAAARDDRAQRDHLRLQRSGARLVAAAHQRAEEPAPGRGSAVPSGHGGDATRTGRCAVVAPRGEPQMSLWSHEPLPARLAAPGPRRCTPSCARPPTPPRRTPRWRAGRDELLATHPDTPLAPEDRDGVHRAAGRAVRPGVPLRGRGRPGRRAAAPRGAPPGPTAWCRSRRSACCTCRTSATWTSGGWRPTAAGCSSRSRTRSAGKQTYGAGRYLLDTVKGADLGGDVDLADRPGHPGRRPELRLQPVLRVRPAVGLPAGPAGQHAAPSRCRSASCTRCATPPS